MKRENVLNCSFSSWYYLFKKVTIKSIVIPFPDGFADYLMADGVVLPDNEDHVLTPQESDSESEIDWSAADDNVAQAPHFPDFDEHIRLAVTELNGTVFPKLNWSSPKDAVWIAMNNSTQCKTISDIYLLLKSSDFIVHDLTQPFKFCEDNISGLLPCGEHKIANVKYELILRKWVDIDPSTEFRCFVKNNWLIAITQRDHTNFYEHIETQKKDIMKDILSFFKEHIFEKFHDDNYVFDVYRRRKDNVKLIDINPFGEVTDSLLFEWQELLNMPLNQQPEFRFMCFNRGVQPSRFRHHGLPRDMVDLSTGEDPYKLIDLLNLRSGSRNQEDSSDDGDQ